MTEKPLEKILVVASLMVLVFLFLQRRKGVAAPSTSSSAAALNVPTVTSPAFTPSYLNYNMPPVDDVQRVPIISFAPVGLNLTPAGKVQSAYANQAPYPACGCGDHGSKAKSQSVAFASPDAMIAFFSKGGAGAESAQDASSNLELLDTHTSFSVN